MATSPMDVRTRYESIVDRIRTTFQKVSVFAAQTVYDDARNELASQLDFSDSHIVAEGLLLAAWSNWEEMVRELFIADLSSTTAGVLKRDVKKFRYKGSASRLAEFVADSPDPGGWCEWNQLDKVKDRADYLIGTGHRFGSITGNRKGTINHIKRARNAIAHGSDSAWDKFMEMVLKAPYGLTKRQRQGITVGRFLAAHKVGNVTVLDYYLTELRASAADLVP